MGSPLSDLGTIVGPIYSSLHFYFYFPVNFLIGLHSFLKMVISSEIIIHSYYFFIFRQGSVMKKFF